MVPHRSEDVRLVATFLERCRDDWLPLQQASAEDIDARTGEWWWSFKKMINITSDQIRSTFRFTAHYLGNLRERPTASTDSPTFILGHEPSWTCANVDNICERFAHVVHTFTKWERCTWNLQHVTWRRLKKGLGDVWYSMGVGLHRCIIGAHLAPQGAGDANQSRAEGRGWNPLCHVCRGPHSAVFGHHRSFPLQVPCNRTFLRMPGPIRPYGAP